MEAIAGHKVLMDAVLPGMESQSRARRLALDAVLVVGFALLTAVFAQIAIRIPTTTVPITGQTFAVLLTGGALGSRRGGLSMLVYMLMGMAALNVFAPSSSIMTDKTLHFILPWSGTGGLVWDLSSGGYIVGFVLAAYIVGLLAERGWDRRSTTPLAMLTGNVGIYLIGLPWLAAFIASGAAIPGTELTYYEAISGGNVLDKTLKGGLYPFIGGDALKLLLAALVLPGAWAIVDRVKGSPPRH
jgi:biotin transport system substrate-specific component